MPIVSTAKMTAEQFLQLGEDPPGIRLELVNGEVAVSPSPEPQHSYVERLLSHFLIGYIRSHKSGRLYGDVDTIFGRHDVRRPDLLFFSKGRVHLIGKKAMQGPPDLCVEIISPSSGDIDREDKFKQYAKGGVAHYWIIDPDERTAEAYTLSRGKYRLAARGKGNEIVKFPPFADLEIPLAELWHPEP
ncbi:MAG TPA: Uma2 family endonuclease [Tepidisphaeraceae bacterium]|jgi:Uma2 family endonuclease|nr:Uma2 family endonuclease [Tepidisphaeraceae bacterium]